MEIAANDADAPTPTDIEIASLLAAISEELASLAWNASDIQEALSSLSSGRGVQAETIKRLQVLDLMTQTLQDLSRTTRQLSQSGLDNRVATAPLNEVLVLTDLKARLLIKGGAKTGPPAPGSVALF